MSLRARDSSPRKQCPPHTWDGIDVDRAPADNDSIYAVRKCTTCKRREHAVLHPDVLLTVPRTLWHLADAAWTAV